jgi:5'-nucleotidase
VRWIPVVVGLVSATLASPPAQSPRPAAHVQVLAINDFHGALEPPDGTGGQLAGAPAGGAAFLATHLRKLRAGHPATITVGAGDLIGASPLPSAIAHDEPAVEALDAMDLRVSAMGNHELDEGPAELLRLQRRAGFRWLAANTLRGGEPLLAPTALELVGGRRIGFVGLTLRNTPLGVAPGGADGLTFADEAQTANRYAAALKRSGAEAVVVLLHEGGGVDGEDPNGCAGFRGPVIDVVERFSADVDAVATAHTHGAYVCDVGGIPVASASSNGRLVTAWDLDFSRGGRPVVRARNVVVRRDVAPDPAVAAIVARARRHAAPVGDRVVGHLDAGVDRQALGTLIADADLAATRELRADAALMNRAGIRSDLAAGAVTYADAFDVLPFSHDLVVRTYTGAQLRAVLSQQYGREDGDADLGRSSNLHETRAGDRVTAVAIDGRPVADDDRVRIAMNRFLAEGGDGFSALRAGTPPVTAGADVDALTAYLGRPPASIR